MRILTLGRLDHIKREIASSWVEPDQEVLEVGCGTGTLAALMTERGGRVYGIDISDPMLQVAREKAPQAEFAHGTATEIDQLGENRFDRIVATLSFSELSDDELEFVLRSSRKLLKPGGKLVVADEVIPQRLWQRLIFFGVRWPLAAITFLLTQNTTHALKGFDERLRRAGYRIVHFKTYLVGTFGLVVAEKA